MYTSINIFIIVLIMIVFTKFLRDSETLHLKCILSDVDGNTYCVRDRIHKKKAADKLARVVKNCTKLIEHLREKKPDHPITKRLIKGFNPAKVMETLPTSEHTAYSENKGEKLAFCLNSDKYNNNKLIDENTLNFVALHELSHIATTEIGHPDIYWKNFKFVLESAVECGTYKAEDYKNNPKSYCGMTISDNPYYDI